MGKCLKIPEDSQDLKNIGSTGRGLKHMEAYNTYGDHIGQ